jgi:hypothetical protein
MVVRPRPISIPVAEEGRDLTPHLRSVAEATRWINPAVQGYLKVAAAL